MGAWDVPVNPHQYTRKLRIRGSPFGHGRPPPAADRVYTPSAPRLAGQSEFKVTEPLHHGAGDQFSRLIVHLEFERCRPDARARFDLDSQMCDSVIRRRDDQFGPGSIRPAKGFAGEVLQVVPSGAGRYAVSGVEYLVPKRCLSDKEFGARPVQHRLAQGLHETAGVPIELKRTTAVAKAPRAVASRLYFAVGSRPTYRKRRGSS